MANYKERRAEIWMIQVRPKGSQQAWSATSAKYFFSRNHAQDHIAKNIDENNFKYYEYRPMRYIPVDLR